MKRRKTWVVVERWGGGQGGESVSVYGPYRKVKAESKGYLHVKAYAHRDDVVVTVQRTSA